MPRNAQWYTPYAALYGPTFCFAIRRTIRVSGWVCMSGRPVIWRTTPLQLLGACARASAADACTDPRVLGSVRPTWGSTEARRGTGPSEGVIDVTIRTSGRDETCWGEQRPVETSAAYVTSSRRMTAVRLLRFDHGFVTTARWGLIVGWHVRGRSGPPAGRRCCLSWPKF